MTSNGRIDEYIREFSRALSGLPESDRREIVDEIRAHLEHRATENKLEEAVKALGSPRECARQFLEELKLQAAFTEAGPARTFSALLALASRRATATLGLFVSGVFYLFAIGFAVTCISEIVSPESAGLWIDRENGVFMLGVFDATDKAEAKEILGLWLIPIAAAMSVLSFLVAHWLGLFFIRLMAEKPRSLI